MSEESLEQRVEAFAEEVNPGLAESARMKLSPAEEINAVKGLFAAIEENETDPGRPEPPRADDLPPVPEIADHEMAGVYNQLNKEQMAIQDYLNSPRFLRLKQIDPQAARQEMYAASQALQTISAKQSQLRDMDQASVIEASHKAALDAIPAWRDAKTMDSELQQLVSYYQKQGIAPEQLRQMAINGQAGRLYSDWRKASGRPIKNKPRPLPKRVSKSNVSEAFRKARTNRARGQSDVQVIKAALADMGINKL